MNAAAVVVLHDSERELAALQRSLARHPPAPRLVLVDTGSGDNPGFGAACNAGLERVHEDVTILLNPDCEALDDSLARLAELARAHPRALHAPRLLDPDGSVQRSAHPVPGTVGALLPAVVPPALLPRAVRERAEPYRAQTARTVGWAIGACLAAATATLRELGPFDPAVHLYFEDMELCLRARARGMPTVLHPQLTLCHAGGHSLLRGGEDFDAIARRRREAVRSTRGRSALALDDAAQALTFAARAARARSRRQLAAWLRAASPRLAGEP
jgi:N-acetylglucosaminyl-diphospho-decaprenol L-rhamnosyltransferase